MFARVFPSLLACSSRPAFAALAEPRRNHTKATSPLHLLRRHNELTMGNSSRGAWRANDDVQLRLPPPDTDDADDAIQVVFDVAAAAATPS